MKKTIISTLAVMLTVPAFATGISPNDTGDNMCVYNVLNTYTGPANLTAGWQANTIQLKWYNGDQQLNVQSAANSCTYDSGLTIPSTQPTKTGYTFAGWKIKTANAGAFLCGITTDMLVEQISSDSIRWKPFNSSDGYGTNGYTMEQAGLSDDGSDLAAGEWSVTGSYGIYRGISSYNNTSGALSDSELAAIEAARNAAVDGQVYQSLQQEYDSIMSGVASLEQTYGENFEEAYENGQMSASDAALFESLVTRFNQYQTNLNAFYLSIMIQYPMYGNMPAGAFTSSDTGPHCWCKVTSFTPNGGGAQCDTTSSMWVYLWNRNNNSSSSHSCAGTCASWFASTDKLDFRGALLSEH